MTALQAKSCSPRPWVHGVTALFRSGIMQILIPFRLHLRVAGHEIRKVFTANKTFCHQEEGERLREDERKVTWKEEDRGAWLLLDGLSERMMAWK